MPCICQVRHNVENFTTHSQQCDEYNRALLDEQLQEKIAWETQKVPCSGQGFAHKPHGRCPGFTYDRT